MNTELSYQYVSYCGFYWTITTTSLFYLLVMWAFTPILHMVASVETRFLHTYMVYVEKFCVKLQKTM